MITKHFKLISILAVSLILSGILAFHLLPTGNAMAEANSIVGTWKANVTAEGMPPFTAIANFSSDGTLTEIEDNGTTSLGAWEKLPGGQYSFTLWGYSLQGGSTILGKVSSTITLDDKGHYSGPFSFQFLDLQGNVLGEGTGTATGVRMHVEPMP